MATIETKPARVISTMLGREHHGIPTCWVTLNYGDGTGQGFGGYDLRHYGYAMVQGIIDAVGAETWESLKGMNVRVRSDESRILAIGHATEEQWYAPGGSLADRHSAAAAAVRAPEVRP